VALTHGSSPEAIKERVLVVDDEPYITDLLATALGFEGFSVEVADNGFEALATAQRMSPDLVLLDVMLPDLEGSVVCERLREQGTYAPVIFLTARDSTEDKVAGLGLADDYVTKPFSVDELVARMRAVLRRGGRDAGVGGPEGFADLVMDPGTREVWRAAVPIELTATEFNLLFYLLVNARRVVSKSDILDHVWGFDFAGDPNIVETYISYLRKKVDEFDPPLLHTVRRVGYTLRLAKP
jgi:two-component system, OmpR family, response regulator